MVQTLSRTQSLASSLAKTANTGSAVTKQLKAAPPTPGFAPGSKPNVITQSGGQVYSNGKLSSNFGFGADATSKAQQYASSITQRNAQGQILNIQGDEAGNTNRMLNQAVARYSPGQANVAGASAAMQSMGYQVYRDPNTGSIIGSEKAPAAPRPSPAVFSSRNAEKRDTTNLAFLNTSQQNLQDRQRLQPSEPPQPPAQQFQGFGQQPPGTTGENIQQGAGLTGSFDSRIAEANSAIDSDFDRANSLLESRLANLDATTQSTVKNIQDSYDRRKEEMKTANAALLATNTQANIRSGVQRYAPEINAGILSSIEQAGIKRLTALDNEELGLINDAQQAADSSQFDLLDEQIALIKDTRAEKAKVVKDLQDEAMAQEELTIKRAQEKREVMKFERDTASDTISAMVSAGVDPTTLPEGYLEDLDQRSGYAPGTSKGLFDVAQGEAEAQSEKDYIDQMDKVIDLTAKLAPNQSITLDGIQYFGTKSATTFEGKEIDAATGDILLFNRDNITNEISITRQKGILTPNVAYTQQSIINSDGTESLWYVPNNPSDGPAVPVNGQVSGGAQGVNDGTIQKAFPAGMTYAEAKKTNPNLTESDFWCLRFVGNMDERGDSFINSVGNTLAQKTKAVDPSISPTSAAIGDYILTNEDARYGHIALINDIRTDPTTGKRVAVLTESNYTPLTVGHTRTISLDDTNLASSGGKVLGFLHSELKPEFTSQATTPLISAPATKAVATSDVSTLRSNFVKESGTFSTIRDAYSRVKIAADNPSAAGDISLIFGYMKLLDPSSTVREGEAATAQNAAGIPDIIRNQWNKLKTGERLNPTQRADFLNQANLQYKSQYESFKPILDTYKQEAELAGIDPTRITGSIYVPEEETTSTESLKKAFPTYSSRIDNLISEGYSIEDINSALSQ